MKEPENSLYTEDWKEVAQKDWKRIRIMLKEGDFEMNPFTYTCKLLTGVSYYPVEYLLFHRAGGCKYELLRFPTKD